MKKIIISLAILMILPTVLAIDVTIEKQSEGEVMILDVGIPATIDLEVTNNGLATNLLFYSFFGLGIEPAERMSFAEGETKNIQLTIYPGFKPTTGFSTFDIFIQAMDKSQVSKRVTVNLINLEDAFEIGAEDFDPETRTMKVYLYNKINYDFEEIDATFKSAFFNLEESFSISPQEKKAFEVNLNKGEFNDLMAGFYTLDTKINYKETLANLETPIRFIEKDIIITTKEDRGFIINTKVIKKTNEGNVVVDFETSIKKNILSRIFTSFDPEPTKVNREGGAIYYTWEHTINPGETQEIIVRTNWVIPLIVLILIVVILVLTKKLLNAPLNMKKRISFVKAKGGEFALKVTIVVTARKYLEKVSISERLPPLVKIYEKFVGEQPSKIDGGKRLLKWNFEKLEEGEKRIITYIIYSKVGVLGKFALPPTTALYEREGKIKEANSNKAFFVAEAIKNRE
jgi:hypothetical protein